MFSWSLQLWSDSQTQTREESTLPYPWSDIEEATSGEGTNCFETLLSLKRNCFVSIQQYWGLLWSNNCKHCNFDCNCFVSIKKHWGLLWSNSCKHCNIEGHIVLDFDFDGSSDFSRNITSSRVRVKNISCETVNHPYSQETLHHQELLLQCCMWTVEVYSGTRYQTPVVALWLSDLNVTRTSDTWHRTLVDATHHQPHPHHQYAVTTVSTELLLFPGTVSEIS